MEEKTIIFYFRRMKKLSTILVIALVLFSCKNTSQNENSTEEFKEVIDLDSLEQTDFILSLGEQFDHKKNGVYSASFGLAWNELESIIMNEMNQVIEEITSPRLRDLARSAFHDDVLKDNEYSKNIEASANEIKVQTYFKFNLSYIEEFEDKFDSKGFKNDSVSFFGCNGRHKALDLLFYKNDNEFAIQLLSKNEEHEIILLKTDFKRLESFKSVYAHFTRYYEKYSDAFIREKDILRVPKINFNIENNFEKIIGSEIKVKNNDAWFVTEAYQRNAFILNEKGAIVESKSKLSEKKEEMPDFKPKKLIFDDDFVVFLKKKEAQYPYFMVYVNNAEILEYEE